MQGEDAKLAIATWRNMARTDGQSPSQLFFSRRQKQQLPMTHAQSSRTNPDLSGRDKTAAAAERYRKRTLFFMYTVKSAVNDNVNVNYMSLFH